MAGIIKFFALVDKLHQHDRLTCSEGNGAESEFRDLDFHVVRSDKDEFIQYYDFSETRLDNFLPGHACPLKKYQHLWNIIIFVFCSFHGQTIIERGLNVNNEFLAENLEEKTV